MNAIRPPAAQRNSCFSPFSELTAYFFSTHPSMQRIEKKGEPMRYPLKWMIVAPAKTEPASFSRRNLNLQQQEQHSAKHAIPVGPSNDGCCEFKMHHHFIILSSTDAHQGETETGNARPRKAETKEKEGLQGGASKIWKTLKELIHTPI